MQKRKCRDEWSSDADESSPAMFNLGIPGSMARSRLASSWQADPQALLDDRISLAAHEST